MELVVVTADLTVQAKLAVLEVQAAVTEVEAHQLQQTEIKVVIHPQKVLQVVEEAVLVTVLVVVVVQAP